jgi:la-related protein 1
MSLIASFNRVRRLTMDEQLVKDVLGLSSVVEVMHDHVRMVGWEQFILPDAAPSTVESGGYEEEAEDDDEEDVVFVLGREAGWTPERQPA